MGRTADELRREIERAMQDDHRLYAELRAQLERTRAFVLQGFEPQRRAGEQRA
jgi:hypothetical protein